MLDIERYTKEVCRNLRTGHTFTHSFLQKFRVNFAVSHLAKRKGGSTSHLPTGSQRVREDMGEIHSVVGRVSVNGGHCITLAALGFDKTLNSFDTDGYARCGRRSLC